MSSSESAWEWFANSTKMNIGSFSEAKKLGNGKYIKSDPLAAGGHSWRIAFYPNGKLAGTTASMSLFLLLDDDDDAAKGGRSAGDEDVVVQARFRFTMNKMCETAPVFMSGTVDAAFSRRRSNAHGFERFVSRDDFEKTPLFTSNQFSIHCSLTVFPAASSKPRAAAAVQTPTSRSGRPDPSSVVQQQPPPPASLKPPVVVRAPPSAPPPTPTPSLVKTKVPAAAASPKPSAVTVAPPPAAASPKQSAVAPPPAAASPKPSAVTVATPPPEAASPKPSVVTVATPPPAASPKPSVVTVATPPPEAASPKPSVVTVATPSPDSTTTSPAPFAAMSSSPPPDSTITSPAPSVAISSSPSPDSTTTTTSLAPSAATSTSPASPSVRPDPLVAAVVSEPLASAPAGQNNGMAAAALSGLPADLGRLLATKKAADVDLEVCGKVFAAHKSVLAARSPVFMEELFGQAKEEDTSFVLVIPDMRPEAFEALLHYLYTDTLPPEMAVAMNSPEEGVMLAEDLLAAADRYELKDLKVLTENKMCNHVGMRTVLPMLAVAERYQCYKLKKMCLKFIGSCENTRAVMATNGVVILAKSSPSVIKDVIAEILDATEATS